MNRYRYRPLSLQHTTTHLTCTREVSKKYCTTRTRTMQRAHHFVTTVQLSLYLQRVVGIVCRLRRETRRETRDPRNRAPSIESDARCAVGVACVSFGGRFQMGSRMQFIDRTHPNEHSHRRVVCHGRVVSHGESSGKLAE